MVLILALSRQPAQLDFNVGAGICFFDFISLGAVLLPLRELQTRMRKFRPIVTSLDEVIITREGDTAVIQYKDPAYATTHFQIGPQVVEMTDQEIVDLYNDWLRAQAQLAAEYKHVVVEIPLGQPQIEYHADSDQWTARGDVLRCLIDDAAEGEREPVIIVDDKELTWREFGRLVCTYAGWGMRIEFVADDKTHRRPKLEVRQPTK